jgi:Ala-tRNA(Pro) deacylase
MPIEKRKKYSSIAHSPAYTTQEIIATTHILRKKSAKTIVFKFDGMMSLVVMPAHERVDFEKLVKLVSQDCAEV